MALNMLKFVEKIVEGPKKSDLSQELGASAIEGIRENYPTALIEASYLNTGPHTAIISVKGKLYKSRLEQL